MITRFLHTRYRVNDLEKTASFYKDVLGLKEVSRHTSGRGSTLAFFQVPGSEEQIEICHFPKSGPVEVQADLTHLAFEVEDLEAFAKAAAEKGYPLSDGPTVSPGSGNKIAFIDGPEGYEFELIEMKK
jgi:lactoylglutathione lyase